MQYSIEPRTRKYVTRYGFSSFTTNSSNKNSKQSLDSGINASKKETHKAFERTGEFLGNKIADAITKLYDDKIRNQEMLKK